MLYIFSIVDKDNIPNAQYLVKSLEKYTKSENNMFQFKLLDTYDKDIKNISKIIKVKEHIEKIDFKDDDLFMLVDALDLFFVKDPSMIPDDFKKINVDVIFGAEIFWAFHTLESRRFFEQLFKNKKLRYLNSGMTLGYAKTVLKIYTDIVTNLNLYNIDNIYKSDQRIISCYFTKNKNSLKFTIDTESIFVFNNTSKLKPDEFKKSNAYCVHVTDVRVKNKNQYDIFQNALEHYGLL